MALKSRYILGDKLAGATNDATDATIYSDKFSVRGAPVWSAHLEWTSAGSDLATAITLWASNKPEPDPSTDTDWVQMTSDYGYDGFFGGDPAAAAASGKDFVDVSNSGALWYKYKAVRSAGSGTISIIVTAKDS
jgi:hypothetical protein